MIGAPNTFAAEHIEQRMYSLISRTLESILGRKLRLNLWFTAMIVAKRTHPGPKWCEIASQGHFSGADTLGYLKGRKSHRERLLGRLDRGSARLRGGEMYQKMTLRRMSPQRRRLAEAAG